MSSPEEHQMLSDLCNKVPATDAPAEPRVRAEPAELRKALVMARAFADAGIMFVPIPITSEQDHKDLILEVGIRIDKMSADEAVIEKQEQADAPRIILL